MTGLLGTTVGALAGFAGAWLAQRAQTRMQREERTHQEQVRWLADKKPLFRDLLVVFRRWREALSDADTGTEDLDGLRRSALKWSVEASLIASEPVRLALDEVRAAFAAVESELRDGRVPVEESGTAARLSSGLSALEDAMRAELKEILLSPRRRIRRESRVRAPDPRARTGGLAGNSGLG
ncbi:hypothetical protein ACL07V_34095 [Streptomyces sp. MB22_4]|uniref:hypothetical protein n=1 Tax=Streptomyces sp. MB22_4 TaxID=3383120 RepID=UPI0039A2204E